MNVHPPRRRTATASCSSNSAFRCSAAQALGKLRYEGALGIETNKLAAGMGDLALAVCNDTKAKAKATAGVNVANSNLPDLIASQASLRPSGVLVVYGTSSGPTPALEIPRLNSGGSLYVTRPTVVHYTATREELRARTDEVFGWVASGQLRVSIGGRYPLADAARAHEDLESRRTTGKLLLLPSEGAATA